MVGTVWKHAPPPIPAAFNWLQAREKATVSYERAFQCTWACSQVCNCGALMRVVYFILDAGHGTGSSQFNYTESKWVLPVQSVQ